MFNLPTQTEMNKALPKNAIFQKLMLNTSQKESFDNDISRINIVNEISERTLNIANGETIDFIFVLLVHLKKKEYTEKNIVNLSKMIDQNIVYVLKYEHEYQLGVYHTKLIKSDWIASPTIPITGLNLDVVWENIVKEINNAECRMQKYEWDEKLSLEQNILEQDRQAKVLKKIEQLERQARTEKQPKKKFELVQEIKRLNQEKD